MKIFAAGLVESSVLCWSQQQPGERRVIRKRLCTCVWAWEGRPQRAVVDVPDSKVQQTCIQVACQPLQREIRFADSMQVQGALCQFSFSKWTNPSLVKFQCLLPWSWRRRSCGCCEMSIFFKIAMCSGENGVGRCQILQDGFVRMRTRCSKFCKLLLCLKWSNIGNLIHAHCWEIRWKKKKTSCYIWNGERQLSANSSLVDGAQICFTMWRGRRDKRASRLYNRRRSKGVIDARLYVCTCVDLDTWRLLLFWIRWSACYRCHLEYSDSPSRRREGAFADALVGFHSYFRLRL